MNKAISKYFSNLFQEFEISQPNDNGVCDQDMFKITGPEGGTPQICGGAIGNSRKYKNVYIP